MKQIAYILFVFALCACNKPASTDSVSHDFVISPNIDNAPVLAEWNGKTADVALIRVFHHEAYNTLCLPFALSEADIKHIFGKNCDIRQLSEADFSGEKPIMNFVQQSAMAPGVPYLIKPAQTISDPVFHSVLIVNELHPVTVGDLTFVGVFSPTAVPENALLLGLDNTLHPASSGEIAATKGYFVKR